MPHDYFGREIKVGDIVNIPFVVKNVSEGEFCNVDLESVYKMPGNDTKLTIAAVNTKQTVK